MDNGGFILSGTSGIVMCYSCLDHLFLIIMSLNRNRLDRFLNQQTSLNKRDIKLALALGKVTVDGRRANDGAEQIDHFSHIVLGEECLQKNTAHYLMLNKPVGVVSATSDPEHTTVLDLLDHPDKNELHIVGRLDKNTSGLVLLTNDSRWSSRLTDPHSKIPKHYRVTLQKPLNKTYINAFAEGMYFQFEDLVTQPAELRILAPFVAEVILNEGRYHQVKRMFGRFRNPVIALHRKQVGNIMLCPSLTPGQYRTLTAQEVSDP